MSSFVGLYTGLSGVQAAQAGLDITSHNVANANTPGYTRQRVELAARPTYQALYGPVGTGVDVQDISRLRDQFLDARFRSAVGDNAANTVRAEFLASVERLGGEPDLGLSAAIGKLWGAAEEWANDPNDPAARRQVLTELDGIAATFRATANAWDQLGTDTEARRGVVIDLANGALGNLADLNTRLANADPKRVGPDVYDQRDMLIDEVSRLTGATARYETNGTVTLTIGGAPPAGTTLLSFPDGVNELALSADGTSIEVGDPAVAVAMSGEIGGLHRSLTEDLPRFRTELDALAETFATAINGLNQGGRVITDDPGPALFAFDDPPGSAAAALRIADGIGIADLAAAGPDDPLAPTPPAAFDGTNARAFADLRTALLAAPDGGPDATIESQLSDLITGLAGSVRSTRAAADAARGVATGAKLARDSQHGVSIDEEMVGLVRYQRALEANARVMTTVDQALDTLVNRVGIVGR
jgi:flagellar hook-associated protein 1